MENLLFSFFSFLYVFSELYEHHYNTNTGKVLFTAAKMLCQMLEADVPMVLPHDMDLPGVIHDLACQAITLCHSGEKYVKINDVQHFMLLKATFITPLTDWLKYIFNNLL